MRRTRPPRRTISQRSELIGDVHEYGLNPDTREIWLYPGWCSPEGAIDHLTAAQFITNLRILESLGQGSVLIHSCTDGGLWNYGIAIYDAIVSTMVDTTLLAHANARSMSSIIPQAARTRVIMPNADFLIHYGSEGFDGNCQSFISEAKWAEVLTERMLTIYADRCVRGPWFRKKRWSRERIREWIRRQIDQKQEVYMDARQAVDYGFFDAVLGDPGYEDVSKLLN